jgi:uncharacterized membrane protein
MAATTEDRRVERWAPAIGSAALVLGAGLVWRVTRDRKRDQSSPNPNGRIVEESVAINRSAEELYRVWRDLRRLPGVIPQLRSVEVLDERHSRWIAEGPGGRRFKWTAEIVDDVPNQLIAWRTVDRSDIVSAGFVQFKPAPGKRGTELRANFRCEVPGGPFGSAVAWAFGDEPAQVVREGLRRFKQLMEAGEIATTDGQPRGAQ